MIHMIQTAVLALMTSAAMAASITPPYTCGQLEQAYRADLINAQDYACTSEDASCAERQLEQLRDTIKHFTQTDVRQKGFDELVQEYDPIFGRVIIGDHVFETVNIDLGDNPFTAFFVAGTAAYAGIEDGDGTIKVGGEFCEELAFEPYINETRKRALCEAVVPQVKEALPATTYSMEICMSPVPDEQTGNQGIDIYVVSFDESTLGLRVQRNLSDVNGWYYVCGANMDRQTNKVTELECEIK